VGAAAGYAATGGRNVKPIDHQKETAANKLAFIYSKIDFETGRVKVHVMQM